MVRDIEEAISCLRENGVQFESPWRQGDAYAVIQDPDGLAIEIVQQEG